MGLKANRYNLWLLRGQCLKHIKRVSVTHRQRNGACKLESGLIVPRGQSLMTTHTQCSACMRGLRGLVCSKMHATAGNRANFGSARFEMDKSLICHLSHVQSSGVTKFHGGATCTSKSRKLRHIDWRLEAEESEDGTTLYWRI